MGFKVDRRAGGPTSFIGVIFAVIFVIRADAQTNSSAGIAWNNIPPAIGADSSVVIPNLVSSRGASTGVRFQMLSRFNGADQNGTISSTAFPANRNPGFSVRKYRNR